jgi:hypothetical protein
MSILRVLPSDCKIQCVRGALANGLALIACRLSEENPRFVVAPVVDDELSVLAL